MFSMVSTRLDIAQVVGVVSRFMSNPSKEHWNAVKWILIFKGHSDASICYRSEDL